MMRNKFLGSHNTGNLLGNIYNRRVTSDGGTIRDTTFSNKMYKFFTEQDTKDSIKFAWFGETGIQQSSNKVNKIYSFISNDATQSTQSNKPYLGGFIAPNEKYCLKNTSYSQNYITHPNVTFNANDPWTFTIVLNWNGNVSDGLHSIFGNQANDRPKFIICDSNLNYRFRFTDGNNATRVGTYPTYNLVSKTSIIHFVRNGTGLFYIYVNGILVDTFNDFNNTSVFNTLMLGDNDNNRCVKGKLYTYIIRSQAFTSTQITNESNFLRNIYPEIESVDIGSTTEKITNQVDREFSSDTGFWSKGTGANINDGVCHYVNVAGASSGIYKSNLLTSGKSYKVTLTIKNYVSGGLGINIGNSTIEFTGNGTFTSTKQASSTGFYLYASANNSTYDIDNISIIELPQTWATSNFEAVCTPMGNIIPNLTSISYNQNFIYSGGTSASDFTTTNYNGLSADLYNDGQLYSIVSGNGFIGNAQRCVINTGFTQLTRSGSAYNQYLKISFKYRSNKPIYFGKADTQVASANTGDAIAVTAYIQYCDYVRIGLIGGVNGDWIEFDEVNVYSFGRANSQELYDYVYSITSGTASQKDYAALKVAAGWAIYDNSSDNGAIYGKLYNDFAIKLLSQDISNYNTNNPNSLWGWRVPIESDWDILMTYNGHDYSNAGAGLKVSGTTYFDSPNTGANNETGFSAIGSGYVSSTNGSFSELKHHYNLYFCDYGKYIAFSYDTNTVSKANYGAQSMKALRLIKS